LPHPAEPHTSDGRPRGSPPPVISSKPLIPVALLGRATGTLSRSFDDEAFWRAVPIVVNLHLRKGKELSKQTERRC